MPRFLLVLFSLFAALGAHADLTIGWISRQPEIPYVWNSSNPSVEGWPAAGSTVTWRANVKNWSDTPQDVAYVWRVDGREIARGTATLAPHDYTAIDLNRAWSFARERLSLTIDEKSLEVFTDALSVGFWVEQSVYDHFRAHQQELGIGSNSFEDFAQRLIAAYNDLAAIAVYDLTPNGVRDRWRLQKIVVTPDGSLPLVPPADAQLGNEPTPASAQPYSTDRTIDLQWGFPASVVAGYDDYDTVSINNPFYIPWVLIHEIGHARYLTDVYAFDVRNVPPGNTIAIAGYSPRRGYVYYTPEQGLMNRNFTFIDRYSAAALNMIAGRRAITGNYNDPENIGSFLNDLPAENRVTIRDPQGHPIADAGVEIYQSKLDRVDLWYPTHYEGEPDLRLRTDANGQVLVGRNPFATNGPVVSYFRKNNTVAIVRVIKDGVARVGFLESRVFNLAYWSGQTALADHELVAGRATPCGYHGPALVGPSWDAAGSPVQFKWRALDDAVAYDVWAASPSRPTPRLLGTTTGVELTVPLSGGATYWWVEAKFANLCPPLRSETSRVITPAAKSRAVRR